MKKIYLFWAVAICSCFALGAKDLPKEFFNVILGETTMEDAIPLMEAHNIKPSGFPDNCFWGFGIEHDGEEWDFVTLRFSNSSTDSKKLVLDEVEFFMREFIEMTEVGIGEEGFMEEEYTNEEKALEQMARIDSIADRYGKKFKGKNAKYLKSEEEACSQYEDGHTSVWIYKGPSAGGLGFMPYDFQVIYSCQ